MYLVWMKNNKNPSDPNVQIWGDDYSKGDGEGSRYYKDRIIKIHKIKEMHERDYDVSELIKLYPV